jgi:hypothetical protein
MPKSLLDRFLEKIAPEPNTGCWLWTAYARPVDGYGEISVGGSKGGPQLAHRVAHELFKGPIPNGLEIDHLCRVRCCVNPDHLEPVTRAVNIERGVGPATLRAKYAATIRCPQGHEYTHGNTYFARTAKGYTNRMCRTCLRDRKRARDAQRRMCVEVGGGV